VKIFTCRGHDWTKRFRKLAADAWHLKAGSAIIDGEVVVPSADGTTHFAVLQNEPKGRSTRIVLVAFDLLYLNGQDLRRPPLTARKAELKRIVAGSDIQFCDSLTIAWREIFKHACKIGPEKRGVKGRRQYSTYGSGRSRDWIKVTCAQHAKLLGSPLIVFRNILKLIRNHSVDHGLGCAQQRPCGFQEILASL